MNLPDWRLPRGVSRALWEYTQQPHIAREYDQSIATSALSQFDTRLLVSEFAERGTLVDLGCGTGRHAVAFAQQGFDVVGVDLSAEMLTQAALKAAQAGVNLGLLRANLCDLDGVRDGVFTYGLLMYATLGMIPTADDRLRVLQHIRRILKPGGRLALHVHNLWFNLFDAQGRAWLLRDRWKSWVQGRPAGDRVVHDRGIPNFQMHVFTRRELSALLKAAGFTIDRWCPLNDRAADHLGNAWCLGSLRANGWVLFARARK